MTSDAKIGLLLGLVFIFIIAFVINGLPRFRSTTNGSELTTNMVSSQNDPLGIGEKEREVQNFIGWPPAQTEAQQPESETSPPLLEDDEDVRFKIKLPENISYPPIIETAQESERAPVEPVGPAPAESTEPSLARLFDALAPQPPAEEKIEIKKPPRPGKPRSPKVYVVSDGDNLAKIAKKLYGPEQGNKHANIMRIYELNCDVLTSPDEVRVGQKLIIPPVVVSQGDQNKPEKTLSSSFFEKVESIGRKDIQADHPKPKPSPINNAKASNDHKQYVIKDGDNLWRIAVEKLGDGSRYQEIAKLNADILEDPNNLRVGTTLKMPAR
jgi:nucleoid-associated protein YgaU